MEKCIHTIKKSKICLALGFFDCLHLGHRKIVAECIAAASEANAEAAIFTFTNAVEKNDNKQIYTFFERERLLHSIGINRIIALPFNEEVKNTEASRFIENLCDKYDVACFVCGTDYRFGKNAVGDVTLLSGISKRKGIRLIVVDDVIDDGKRISSTLVKQLLSNGNVEKANHLLCVPYSISGKVVHGRGEGHVFGIPTANVCVDGQKLLPKSGVYACIAIIEDKAYKSVVNVGQKPTFDDLSFTIEALIGEGFNGDVYGKEITLVFYRYLRDTVKFDEPAQLAKTVKADLKKWEDEQC